LNIDDLILKCKQQDKKAQELLYRTFSPKFFVLCLKYCSSYEQAKDSLHDGFIKIYQNLNKYTGKGSFEGWMTRIMINNAINEYQGKSVFISIEDSDFQEDNLDLEQDYSDLSFNFLMEIIQLLPDQYRLVFCLYVLDGFSHKEISQTLNISIGTSKSNLSRARLKLQESIAIHEQTKLASK